MLPAFASTVCTASICSVAFRKLLEPALADPHNLQAGVNGMELLVEGRQWLKEGEPPQAVLQEVQEQLQVGQPGTA
eukprot:s1071_g16.t1